MTYIKRFLEQDLKEWINSKNRKPLVLRGARQVGKSTLIRHFAKENNLKLIEINLERHIYLDNIFKSLTPDKILKELEIIAGINISEKNSLLFLDEIQATPYSLSALRYFYEEKPELPIIAAGSLLEFTLADHNFSMPVGRIEYANLYPISFKEFLLAVSPHLAHYLSSFKIDIEILETAHKELNEKLREYFFIGGMPEAIAVYHETKSITMVKKVHSSIVNTYIDDFSKFAKKNELLLLQKIFNSIPAMIGEKVKYVNFSREERSGNLKTLIDYLCKARICHKVNHSDCSGHPLQAGIDHTKYKLIFLDIGLMNYILGVNWSTIQNYENNSLINEGPIAEQFIGQHLLLLGDNTTFKPLIYWMREGKKNNAEIDYVYEKGYNIIPIEVKAGKSGSLKSLQQFILKKNRNFSIRFYLNKPVFQKIECITREGMDNREVSFQLLSLPLYFIEEMPRIIDYLSFK